MKPADSAVSYLLSLLGSIRKESFGLQRMKRLMDELGNPEMDPGIIHIAGTNGKGSTAAMIESGLRAAGERTGLYNSPHLSHIRERFLLDGLPVEDLALADAIEPVRQANERIVAGCGSHMHPTFFESATAVALLLFRHSGVRYRIIEVGLGGRLDASNVVRPQLAIVTHVARDHERFLGRDLGAIAAEKAAIIKPGCRAVVGKQAPEARQVLLRHCRELDVESIDVESDWRVRDPRCAAGRWTFQAVGRERSVRTRLGLAGEHQIENGLTAIATLADLGVSNACIETGLREASWPGRLEFAKSDRRVLLDVAHNPGGARALARFLGREARGRKVTLIYGTSRDKAVDEIAGWLFPLADRVLLTRSRVQRAASPLALLEAVGHYHSRVETADVIEEALRMAYAGSGSDDWIVVTGSLFLVGEARELVG